MENPEELQLDWHKHSNQGCLYAAFLASNIKNKDVEWKINCFHDSIDSELIEKIDHNISECIKNPNIQLVSFILPLIKTQNDLINFISLAETRPNWKAIYTKIDSKTTSVGLRVNLQEKDDKGDQIYSWLIGLGPFSHFAETRQSPFTEISLIVKTKQHLKEKYNRISLLQQTTETVPRTGDTNDAHIADMYIDKITNVGKKDNRFWSGTKIRKRKVLNIINYPLTYKHPKTKAGITFLLDDE